MSVWEILHTRTGSWAEVPMQPCSRWTRVQCSQTELTERWSTASRFTSLVNGCSYRLACGPILMDSYWSFLPSLSSESFLVIVVCHGLDRSIVPWALRNHKHGLRDSKEQKAAHA